MHMGTSNAIREAKKRAEAQDQIDANLSMPAEVKEDNGATIITTRLFPMGSYSTKFMTADDQLVLAVDKIDAPEVKVGMTPQAADTARYLNPNAEVYDYATHLSLNDGDPAAFKTISSKMEASTLRKYMFETVPEDRGITEDDFVLFYLRKIEGDGIGFTFDMYDGGKISGSESVPSATASIELSKEYTERGVRLHWEYVVIMHSDENKKPKDALIKSEYLKLQEFMRAIIVTLGILPSNL